MRQRLYGGVRGSFCKGTLYSIAKMVSSMCGVETITRQQKNTSFGANEFRDGVSYNEHQQRKDLVEYSDLANLATGECYVLLPVPLARLGRIQTPEVKLKNKNEGFIQSEEEVSSSGSKPKQSPSDNTNTENKGSKRRAQTTPKQEKPANQSTLSDSQDQNATKKEAEKATKGEKIEKPEKSKNPGERKKDLEDLEFLIL